MACFSKRNVRFPLRKRFQAADDVYVGGDLLLYYRQGDPKQVVCPDVMVVRGVPKLPMRRTFQPVAPEPDSSLVSQTTGVTLRMEGDWIRMVETATGRPYRRIAELDADLERAEKAAAQEKAARHALEAEIARLRGELERR